MAVKYQGGKAVPAFDRSKVDRILYDQIYQSVFRFGGPAAGLEQAARMAASNLAGENGAALKKLNPQLHRALMLISEANMAMQDAKRH